LLSPNFQHHGNPGTLYGEPVAKPAFTDQFLFLDWEDLIFLMAGSTSSLQNYPETRVPVQILIVDDDEATLHLIKMGLEKRNFRVELAQDGTKAMEAIRKNLPDLILLDLMMPYVDGLQLCKRIRASYDIPIIVLSAISLEDTIVRALNMGADDYLIKPFGFDELTARIYSVSRRSLLSTNKKNAQIKIGGITVQPESSIVTLHGNYINLTPTEFNLLTELLLHSNEVIPHKILLERVWGKSYTNSVEYLHIYISRLRQKLADVSEIKITTYPGVGYMLDTNGNLTTFHNDS
jgi:DNA-binding response OmpR family regulator